MALEVYSLTDRFESPGAALADDISLDYHDCGAANGTIAVDRKGIKLTTHASANAVVGFKPDAAGVLAATNFLKTSDELVFEVDIVLDGSLPSSMFMGFMDAPPDNSDTGEETGIGKFRNADLSYTAAFWFNSLDRWGKWNCVYMGTGKNALSSTPFRVKVDEEYKLKVALQSDRTIKFYINGHLVHTSSYVIDDTAMEPALYVTGNAKILYCSRVFVQKNY